MRRCMNGVCGTYDALMGSGMFMGAAPPVTQTQGGNALTLDELAKAPQFQVVDAAAFVGGPYAASATRRRQSVMQSQAQGVPSPAYQPLTLIGERF